MPSPSLSSWSKLHLMNGQILQMHRFFWLAWRSRWQAIKSWLFQTNQCLIRMLHVRTPSWARSWICHVSEWACASISRYYLERRRRKKMVSWLQFTVPTIKLATTWFLAASQLFSVQNLFDASEAFPHWSPVLTMLSYWRASSDWLLKQMVTHMLLKHKFLSLS